jgi:hypothetical protein
MGYRSQVAYWFEGKNAQAVVMQHMADYPCQECFNELVITDNGVYFEDDDAKWYNEYESVQWHNNLFALAQEMSFDEDSDLTGQFVRVGEDHDDVETTSFGDDPYSSSASIQVFTQMSYDFPAKEK